MKWMIRGVFAFVLLFGLAMGVGYFISPALTVERSAAIRATPDIVFPYMNEMDKLHSWSPWYLRDIDAQVIFSGPEAGVGAEAAWDSAKEGIGFQTITDSAEESFVRTQLNLGGREGLGTYAIEPTEDESGSTVLVIIEGELGGFPYVQRLFKPFYRSRFESNIDQSLDMLSALIARETEASN